MEKKKITTRLRFKDNDGNDFPEWEEKKIGQLVKISYGKDQKQIVAENGEFPILGTGGIIGRTNQFLYDKPSVLIGRKGTIDKPVYMDSPFWTVDTLFYTQVFENTIPKWLYYKFQTINWYLYNEASGVPSLSASTINQIEISLPSIEEQTKIANFLSAIDEKIENFEKELDELKAYKKGLMQSLFSEDDQTQMGGGKLLVFSHLENIRFKDDNGNDFPAWEKHEIGNFVDFLTGYPFDGEDISEDSKGIPLMRGINITEGSIRHSMEIDKYYCGDTRKIEKYFLKEEDLVIGMDGSKVGKNSALIDSTNSNSILVQRVARLRQKENSSIRFIYQHINSLRFHKYVDEVKTSSGIPHISADQIKKFKISFPCLPEQTKIANFLSAIDDRIDHCSSQIGETAQYKKGLLQQMFV